MIVGVLSSVLAMALTNYPCRAYLNEQNSHMPSISLKFIILVIVNLGLLLDYCHLTGFSTSNVSLLPYDQ